MLHGKIPYRDFWYDKPPLSAVYYLSIAAYSGWPLRILDAIYVILSCFVVYLLAREWWSEEEGVIAAVLLAFFTTFYLPSAVIPFAADAVMLLPHLGAIYFARRRQAALAGVCCGIAFYANPKAIFVCAVCFIWLWPRVWKLLASFAAMAMAGALALSLLGAWPGYVEQVWRWGFQYAAGSPVTHPLSNGLLRSSNWAGFHFALLIGSAYTFWIASGNDRWKLATWIVLSFAAVALGNRFAPHYFLQLLPALVVASSHGVAASLRSRRKYRVAILAIALLVPLIRFGPRYVLLATDMLRGMTPNWKDVAMDVDSRMAADFINSQKNKSDTLFVWGYRPDVYVYSRLASDSLFWDSQPLTGVAADRHLSATGAIYGGPAKANRERLLQSRPAWIVDGLGLLNPKLSPDMYPELRAWLGRYELVHRTPLTLIYRRKKTS